MKDMFGVLFSALCIVHCALTPMLLVLGVSSVGLAFLEAEWIHLALLVPMFLLAAMSFPKSYKLHKKVMPLCMGVVGVVLMVVSIVGPHEYESYFAIASGILLIVAHLINRQLLARFYRKIAVNPSEQTHMA